MLKQIKVIKNVGRFFDYSAQPNTSLKKLNIIYGVNGSGKTMLSAILRSLKTNNPNFIIERKTLGSTTPQKVIIEFSNNTAIFDNGAWNKHISEIEVFDTNFIDSNVYSGSFVGKNTRKNLLEFVVGEQGVTLANKIDQNDQEIRINNKKIEEIKNQINRITQGKITIDNFIYFEKKDDVDIKIDKLKERINTQKKSQIISDSEELGELSLTSVKADDLNAMLKKQIDDVSAESEKIFKKHIEDCLDKNGEHWISSGLKYLKYEKCPFCGQLISGLSLVAAYKDYFNQSYKKLKSDIADEISNIKNLLSRTELFSIDKKLEKNSTLLKFWGQYIELNEKEKLINQVFDYNELNLIQDSLLTSLENIFEKKLASPLEKMALTEEILEYIEQIKVIKSKIDIYNDLIKQINEKIKSKKQEIKSDNLIVLETKLKILELNKERFQENTDKLCKEYIKFEKETSLLKKQKSLNRKNLDDYLKNVFDKYQNKINEYLRKFNASFEITKAKGEYAGGKAGASYKLLINNSEVGIGPKDQSIPTPNFKNTLSSGDKSTLAFAFFIAKLELENNLQDRIIVIDDPISSLDIYRKERTQQVISSLEPKVKQIIVLTHDFDFASLLWDANNNATSTLVIKNHGGQSQIRYYDLEEEGKTSYQYNLFKLKAYVSPNFIGEPIDVAKCIRPLLEGHLKRMWYPDDEFQGCSMLGHMIKKINESSPSERIFKLKPYIEEIAHINEYSKQFHHDEYNAKPISSVNDCELMGYVRGTLELRAKLQF